MGKISNGSSVKCEANGLVAGDYSTLKMTPYLRLGIHAQSLLHVMLRSPASIVENRRIAGLTPVAGYPDSINNRPTS